MSDNASNPRKTRNMVMDSPEMETTYIGTHPGRHGRRDTGIPDEYRDLNVLVTGAVGEGKTQATSHAVLQDVVKGRGGVAVAPKGDFLNDILAKIPDDRLDDVIYINPRFSPAINVLEPVAADQLPDEILSTQKQMIVDELIQLFKRRAENWGDRFGHVLEVLLRALLELNIEHGESNTLMDVYRCVQDNEEVQRLRGRVGDPVLRDDLEFIENLSDSDLQPLAYRLRDFVGNETIRPMIAAEESEIDFRAAVDDGKFILVEVQKGEVGLDVAQITTSIVLSKVWSAIQSRIVQAPEDRDLFNVYIDEFQNFGTDDSVLSTMLSEGREYGLGCWLVTQLLNREEISADFRETVLTNTQSKLVFRAESKDRRMLASALKGVEQDRLGDLNSYRAFLQVPGMGSRPSAKLVETYPPWPPDRDRGEVRELKEELAAGSTEVSVEVESRDAGEESGESVTAGGELHDVFLEAARSRLNELSEVESVAVERQEEGVSRQDGIVFFEDGSKAYLEAELSSLSKPVKVLRNLKRAHDAGVECIFVVEEGRKDRLESIVSDPVNRSGDSHEDDDGSFDYYRGEDGEFTDIEFVEEADYRVIEISVGEVEEMQQGIEEQCPLLDTRSKDELRQECMYRTEDGHCMELGKPCVLIEQ